MKRPRRVFGRIRQGGYVFELRPTGLFVKRKFDRRGFRRLPLETLAEHAREQPELFKAA